MISAEYDRFSVVAFAPDPVRESIEDLRRRLPASGRPIIAPHVTLKDTFVDPVDLNQIAARVAATCEPVKPIEVSLGELYDYTSGEHASIGFRVLAPAELADLHRRRPDAPIARVRCPVLAILGTNESSIGLPDDLETVRRNSRGAPRVELRVLEGADHSYAAQEAELAEVLADWVAGVSSDPSPPS